MVQVSSMQRLCGMVDFYSTQDGASISPLGSDTIQQEGAAWYWGNEEDPGRRI